MASFTKLDSSLTASSIWNEPDPVRIVWITMLSMADKDGYVKGSVVGLSHLARKTLKETQAALQVLSSPDPNSGRKELEGRRIVETGGGWNLVTHCFYRESGMSEDTKRYWREKKAQQRMSETVKDKVDKSETLASASGIESESAKGESEGKSKARCTQAEAEDFCESLNAARTDGVWAFNKWVGNGWINGSKPIRDWKATLRAWHAAGYLASQKNGHGAPSTPAPKGVNVW